MCVRVRACVRALGRVGVCMSVCECGLAFPACNAYATYFLFWDEFTGYCHKFKNVFMWSAHYSCQILIKLEFSWQNFEKSSISSFIKIRPEGVELFHADERTDGHEEANSRFSQFGERALKIMKNMKWRRISNQVKQLICFGGQTGRTEHKPPHPQTQMHVSLHSFH